MAPDDDQVMTLPDSSVSVTMKQVAMACKKTVALFVYTAQPSMRWRVVG